MNVQDQISILKIVQNEENWFISVNEDPQMRNATLNNGKRLKQREGNFYGTVS